MGEVRADSLWNVGINTVFMTFASYIKQRKATMMLEDKNISFKKNHLDKLMKCSGKNSKHFNKGHSSL